MGKRFANYFIFLLIVCVISTGAFGCNRKDSNSFAGSTNQEDTATSDLNKEMRDGNSQNEENTTSDPISEQRENESLVKESVAVRFLNSDYSLISMQNVKIGGDAIPPVVDFVPPQSFFVKWDGDYHSVTTETNILPIYESIASKDNAIGFNSIYTGLSQEFSIVIDVQGKVDFAGMDLLIECDSGIKIDSIVPCKGFAEYSYDSEKNEIVFSFANATTVAGAMTLLTISGSCAEKPNSASAIKINVVSMSTIDLNGEIQNAPYTVFNGSIYVK